MPLVHNTGGDLLTVAALKEYYGVFFDPQSGSTYKEGTNGALIDTGFTFEPARWSGGFGFMQYFYPTLNPFSFATQETADKMLAWVRARVPKLTEVRQEETEITGPFKRTPERLIVVRDIGRRSEHSAGLLANAIIRNGEEVAWRQLVAELKTAGIQFES